MKKLVAVRLSEQQMKQLDELVEQGYGNQSDVIRMALDRLSQSIYDLSHAPFTDDLPKAENQLRLRFIELARLRAKQLKSGWVDVVSGKTFTSLPEHYSRYRHAKVDETGVENFLKENGFLEAVR